MVGREKHQDSLPACNAPLLAYSHILIPALRNPLDGSNFDTFFTRHLVAFENGKGEMDVWMFYC